MFSKVKEIQEYLFLVLFLVRKVVHERIIDHGIDQSAWAQNQGRVEKNIFEFKALIKDEILSSIQIKPNLKSY